MVGLKTILYTEDKTIDMKPGQTTNHHKMKILCIEDERFIGELYERALTNAGYEVKLVFDGVEGLSEIQTNQYDIVLLDIMIPNITGSDVLKKIRTESPNLRSRIIITTNLEQSEESRAEIEKQADGYIVKAEITPRELVSFIQHFKN